MSLKNYFLLITLLVFGERTFCLADNTIKLGISAPLTGSAAAWGQDLKNVLLFQEHLNF